ncbi:MAG: hypothetical protein GQE15_17935 [Archangiaceae bacterium]|nr:hypothetical protein [Archangiaceae bacterium]
MRAFGWVVVSGLVSFVAAAEPNLERAKALVGALQFPAAKSALLEAKKAQALTHAEVLDLYELSGIVAGSTKDPRAATEAVRVLLVLEPGFKLKGKYSPKVTTPFFEARALAKQVGSPDLVLDHRDHAEGVLTKVVLRSTSDGGGLVKQVRLDVDEDGATRVVTLPWAAQLEVAVRARKLVVTPVLLSEAGWRLVEPAALISEAPAPPPPPPPAVTVPVVVVATPAPAATTSGVRTVGYVLGGVGLAAAGLGAYFGVRSQTARTTLLGAVRDGVVTGVTRAQALELNREIVTGATLANLSFASAGALIIGGVVCWLVGAPPSTVVSLVPLEGGGLGSVGVSW